MANIIQEYAFQTQLFHINSVSDNIWSILATNESKFYLRYRPSYDDIVIEHDIGAPSVIINTYTLGKITDMAARFGMGVSKPFVTAIGTLDIPIRQHVEFQQLSFALLDKILANFSTTVEILESYIDKVIYDCELNHIDVSMWEDLDISDVDLAILIERRYLIYPTWQDFSEYLLSTKNLPNNIKAQTLDIVAACELFEEINDHLNLPEIAHELESYLLDLQEERTKVISKLEVN